MKLSVMLIHSLLKSFQDCGFINLQLHEFKKKIYSVCLDNPKSYADIDEYLSYMHSIFNS